MISIKYLRELVKRALNEDIGTGDVTTNAVAPGKARARAIIYARENGVIAGLDLALEIFRQLDKKIKIRKLVKDGKKVRENQPIAELKGKTRALLTGERTALNFLQHLSGIATLTREYADAVKPYRVKILDTRKTIPGMRILEKYAVKMSGGCNHRLGLYDMAMIKDNHLKISRQSLPTKLAGTATVDSRRFTKNLIQKLRKKIPKKMKIEVEAKNLREVNAALEAGADIIMLDNMKPQIMRKAVKFVHRASHPARLAGAACIVHRKKPIIEASGNVTLQNVKVIAMTGVDWISIGRLTHSAPALDMSMEIV